MQNLVSASPFSQLWSPKGSNNLFNPEEEKGEIREVAIANSYNWLSYNIYLFILFWGTKWEDHLAVTKLGLRKGLGLLRKTSSWSLTFKNTDPGIGDRFPLIQVTKFQH